MEYIKTADDWYSNELIEKFHKRVTVNGQPYVLKHLDFAKTCCNDDANLCEVLEITSSASDKDNDELNKILKANNFDTIFRRQVEKTSALGTTACYVVVENADVYEDGSVKNGELKLNYVDAGNYIPLTVVNEQVIEAAFGSQRLVNGKDEFTIVIFTKDADTGRYVAESVLLDDEGNEKASNKIELSETKPFAVYRTAETNNLREMGEGYGLPKVYDNISLFEIVDLAFNVLFTDLDKGEKIILANDILCKYDENGNVVQSPESKKMFVLTGERLPEQNSLIHEYNPDIRIDEIRNTFETVLSLLTLRFGFGAKKYTFEDGRITTATEYIGSKQDQMQALNRQRYQSTLYITEIVNAIKACSNMFNGTNYSLDEEVVVEYDDSYIVDKESELERKRNDAQTFDIPELLIWYLMDAYHITEEEATNLVNREAAEKDDDNIEE